MISYKISHYHVQYHVWYHTKNYDIAYDIIYSAFLALYDIVKKPWYHIWYHSLWYDIRYDITKTIIKSLSCAILLWFRLLYHIHFIRFCLWYQNYVILSMILAMIWPSDISITWYLCHVISQIWWYHSLCHGTCAGGWRGLGAPGARCSTASSLAIANMLGRCVQLNSDGLDPAHGLVALAAARVMHHVRFVVIKKSRLAAAAAAGCAAHAGKAPMHSTRWHWGFKYGLGVQDGFKLETGDQVEEEGEAGEYSQSRQNLKAGTPSPDWTWPIESACPGQLACVAHGGRLPQVIEGCSITAATTDVF